MKRPSPWRKTGGKGRRGGGGGEGSLGAGFLLSPRQLKNDRQMSVRQTALSMVLTSHKDGPFLSTPPRAKHILFT